MTYQPGIPTGTVPLNQDYQNLQNNFSAANTIFGIDHLPFANTTPQQGYHTAAHLVPVSTTTSNPPNNQPINGYTATPGYGQVFSAQINDGIVTDEALYFLSGGNRLMQLTRNFVPSAATNGYTFLPGGLIFQWGKVTFGSRVGVLNFSVSNIAFPANCFQVWTSPFYTGSNPNAVGGAVVKLNTNVSFNYAFLGGDANSSGFFWAALGN